MNSAGFALILSVLVGAFPVSAAAADKDIVDTAAAAGSFTTLVTAIQAADLVDALKGPWPLHCLRSHGRRVQEVARRNRGIAA